MYRLGIIQLIANHLYCKGFQAKKKSLTFSSTPSKSLELYPSVSIVPWSVWPTESRREFGATKKIGASENIWREWKKQFGQIFCCQIFVDLQVLVVFLIIFKGLPSEESKVRPKGKTASGSQTFGRRSCEKLLLAIPNIFF